MNISGPKNVDLSINTEVVRGLLTGFIWSELQQAGLKKAILGLSGGLDSALVCMLAAEAMGKENVLAVRMPYKSSSPESLEHAQLMVEKTGVETLTVPITDMADALIGKYPEMDRVRRGNIMARMRMIVLYDLSAAHGGMVIGTGNKTEILLGYSTIHGDSACGINPLGDLYKTQVRQLSRAIGVPEVIVAKPPTADLFAGQTDEGDLGYTYAEVDQLLYLLVDEIYSKKDCEAAGFSPDFVQKVVERIRRNNFKRMLPKVAKISSRTSGYESVNQRDWGI